MIVSTLKEIDFIRRATVAACLSAALVSSASLVVGQTPATTQAPAAPREKQAAGPTAAPTRPAVSRAECQRYVDVLAGRKKDPELLKKPQVKALAAQSSDLVTCGAIASDSEDLCKLVSRWVPCPGCEPVGNPAGKERVMGCYRMRFVLNELRNNPKGRSFMLPFTREECPALKDLEPSCKTFVDVLRSGDVGKCPTSGAFEPLCRAFITLDKSHCVPIKGLPDDLPGACKEMIDQRGFLAKGLTAVAESGPPRDRKVAEYFGDPNELQTFAKAGVGQKDACKAYEKAAMDQCMASSPEQPAAATPVSDKPIPATPAP